MEDNLGEGLKMKSQDELIGENGLYKKRLRANRFKVPMQTKSKDKFVDARSEPLSTILRTAEEHEVLDNLNNNFSNRLDEVNNTSSLPMNKGKKKKKKNLKKPRMKLTKIRNACPIKKVDTFFILKDTFCILRDTSRYV
ncbi:hypothetical protein C1646_765178 [Rhizophagus diaphanus]|nr:hypothetical protein C1646_765178 [Rhizophagus diaphanus] [Rhizophagus sp. MUCL 43196]